MTLQVWQWRTQCLWLCRNWKVFFSHRPELLLSTLGLIRLQFPSLSHRKQVSFVNIQNLRSMFFLFPLLHRGFTVALSFTNGHPFARFHSLIQEYLWQERLVMNLDTSTVFHILPLQWRTRKLYASWGTRVEINRSRSVDTPRSLAIAILTPHSWHLSPFSYLDDIPDVIPSLFRRDSYHRTVDVTIFKIISHGCSNVYNRVFLNLKIEEIKVQPHLFDDNSSRFPSNKKYSMLCWALTFVICLSPSVTVVVPAHREESFHLFARTTMRFSRNRSS